MQSRPTTLSRTRGCPCAPLADLEIDHQVHAERHSERRGEREQVSCARMSDGAVERARGRFGERENSEPSREQPIAFRRGQVLEVPPDGGDASVFQVDGKIAWNGRKPVDKLREEGRRTGGSDHGAVYGNMASMLKTGLEFAPGTTEECKRLVGKIPPASILMAYRTARENHKSTDIVLVMMPDESEDIHGGPRLEYAKHLTRVFGARAAAFGVYDKSAHSVMKLPGDSEAMWLVIDIRGADLPIMCVIYATPYKEESASLIH